MDDEDELAKEISLFKKVGGSCIVDSTTTGIRSHDPDILQRLSRRTGVHIVLPTGYYLDAVHPNEVNTCSIDDLAARMVDDIELGFRRLGSGSNSVDSQSRSSIKAGSIGEIGCSWPLTTNERKVLLAAARAQRLSGAPLIIHPGRHENAPIQIIRILKSGGADISKTVMSHIDRTLTRREDYAKMVELAETGCYLEFDLFGVEVSEYQFNAKVDMMSDGQRIHAIQFVAL